MKPFVQLVRGRVTGRAADLAITSQDPAMDQMVSKLEKLTAPCWLAIRPGNDHRERIVAWQPAQGALYDKGFFDDNETVAAYLSMVHRSTTH